MVEGKCRQSVQVVIRDEIENRQPSTMAQLAREKLYTPVRLKVFCDELLRSVVRMLIQGVASLALS